VRAALAVPPQVSAFVVAGNHDRTFKLITWEGRPFLSSTVLPKANLTPVKNQPDSD
jgi:hypothetical protein